MPGPWAESDKLTSLEKLVKVNWGVMLRRANMPIQVLSTRYLGTPRARVNPYLSARGGRYSHLAQWRQMCIFTRLKLMTIYDYSIL